MKNAFIFLFLLTGLSAGGEDIGAVFIGVNKYLDVSSRYSEISSQGTAIGFLLPIRFPNRPVHLKVRTAFHPIDASINGTNSSFLHITNEFLIGYKWFEIGRFRMLPQIGLGAVGERYKISKESGGAHADILVDLSCRFQVDLGHFSLGALLNAERDFNMGYGSFLSPNRVNLSLILSK